MITGLMGITASLCLGFSKMVGSYEMIVVGRLLYGIAIGISIYTSTAFTRMGPIYNTVVWTQYS